MGFFKRGSVSNRAGNGLPADIVGNMERVGRHALTPGSPDYSQEQEAQLPLFPFAQSDPEGFLTAVADTVTRRGGLAAYGAGCTAWNLLTSEARTGAAYDTIMDGAVAHARSSRVPTECMPPYMIEHFVKRGGVVAEW
jgi:hypothetical protein